MDEAGCRRALGAGDGAGARRPGELCTGGEPPLPPEKTRRDATASDPTAGARAGACSAGQVSGPRCRGVRGLSITRVDARCRNSAQPASVAAHRVLETRSLFAKALA